MIIICHCGEVLYEETITPCKHYTKKELQDFISYMPKMKSKSNMRPKEIELPLPTNKEIPEEMDCPSCYAKIVGPKYLCKICNSQVIFIEE